MNLKSKMTIAVSSLVALLLLVTTLFTLVYFEHRITETISDQQLSTCSYIADEIDNTLLTVQEVLVATAGKFPPDAVTSPEAAERFLQSRTVLYKYFNHHLFVVAADGRFIAESFSPPHGRKPYFGDEPFFIRSVETGRPQISGLVSCCRDKIASQIAMSAPVLDKNGKVIAVIAGSFELRGNNLLTRFGRLKVGKRGFIRIVSSDNAILMHPDEKRILQKTVPDNQRLVERALKGFSGTEKTLGRDGADYLTSVRKLKSTDWLVLASVPSDEVMRPIKVARLFFAGIAVAGIVAALLVVSIFMNYLTRPIAAFTRHLRELPDKEGNDRHIRISTGDEIEEMATALNGMVSELDSLTANLEQRVEERTTQLAEANRLLLQEAEQRSQAQEEISALNEDLMRQRGALETANQELESFSYSVSHDLRAPLRHVSAYSTILLEECGSELTEETREYLERMQSSCRRMEVLIDSLLSLSHASRRELKITTVDLTALCYDVVRELREGDPNREVSVDIADGMMARGDLHLLRIVLQNIIGNAWKYTAKTESPRIEVSERLKDGRPEFIVRDNGAGFEMAYAGKLFDPFQRLHRANEFEGTGIGLATVMRIIKRHGGTIRAEGEPGKGATFMFTLG